jgi:hypothetical protein
MLSKNALMVFTANKRASASGESSKLETKQICVVLVLSSWIWYKCQPAVLKAKEMFLDKQWCPRPIF